MDEAVELVDLGLDAGLIFVLGLVSIGRQLRPGGFREEVRRETNGSRGCPEAMVDVCVKLVGYF